MISKQYEPLSDLIGETIPSERFNSTTKYKCIIHPNMFKQNYILDINLNHHITQIHISFVQIHGLRYFLYERPNDDTSECLIIISSYDRESSPYTHRL